MTDVAKLILSARSAIAVTRYRYPRLLSGRPVVAVAFAVATLSFAAPVSAQEIGPVVFAVTQQDLNDDGKPDVTSIDCAFATDRDHVTVYDRGGDMPRSADPALATDFVNDLWVFDARGDGVVELVIDFQTDGAGVSALLWDDQDGDGTVHYDPEDHMVTESRWPTIQVVARDGWWERDGKLNFNLEITVDGPVQASFSSKSWLQSLATDGTPDFHVQVRDTDEDGRPDFQWVDAWPEAPELNAVRRTEIAFSSRDDEAPVTGGIFWPFLGSTLDWDDQRLARAEAFPADLITVRQERSGYTKFYNVSMPPIQVLWNKASLLYVAEFVASRFNDDNWFVYSIERAHPGDRSEINFEAPFAFYDLADDDDGYPELAVRFEQYLERDLFPFRKRNPEPVQVIRYSWDQDNDQGWNYKLGLIGRHAITSSTRIGDLELGMVPPPDVPRWVTENVWDGATFVVAENALTERWTSEGIYDWDPTERWRDEYVTGLSTVPPTPAELAELPVGLRGEYAFDLHRSPQLYLSPIDRRLHLLGAQGGVWKVDATREIRYASSDGDYIDQWTLVEQGERSQAIYVAPEHVVFQDRSGVQIIPASMPASVFNVAPPTTNDERLALDQLMQPYHIQPAPWDFESLLAELGDPHTHIKGARLSDFRLTLEGFRFVIQLERGFEVDGEKAFANLRSRSPGAYVITYDGAFHLARLTPPELGVSLRVPSDSVSLGSSALILAEATNQGQSDARNRLLILEAQNGDARVVVTQRPVDVLAGIPTQIWTEWKPTGPGLWQLHARLINADEEGAAATASIPISVSSSRAPAQQILVLSTGGETRVPPLIAVVIAFLVIAFATLWLAVTARRAAPGDE